MAKVRFGQRAMNQMLVKVATRKSPGQFGCARGRSFGKALLGSVSERVIGKAKCAVLVVKA